MTQNTRAEALRKMIADEDEYGYDCGSGMPSNVLPKTTSAMKVFLERLHEHETSRRYRLHEPSRCLFCITADDMIEEFK